MAIDDCLGSLRASLGALSGQAGKCISFLVANYAVSKSYRFPAIGRSIFSHSVTHYTQNSMTITQKAGVPRCNLEPISRYKGIMHGGTFGRCPGAPAPPNTRGMPLRKLQCNCLSLFEWTGSFQRTTYEVLCIACCIFWGRPCVSPSKTRLQTLTNPSLSFERPGYGWRACLRGGKEVC